MNRYQSTFSTLRSEDRIAFIPFWMIGDPTPADSQRIIEQLAESADILELGMPFSDPLADGPTIQASVNRALEAGTTLPQCFEVIGNVRVKFQEKPIGLLVYLNLILSYGVEEFFATCEKQGVDSVLIPEMPVEEIALVEKEAQAHDIDLVFLVSTNTPEDRVAKVIEHSGGFIYAVSTPSITGAKTEIAESTLAMILRLKSQTDLPICVGFGISSPDHIQKLKKAGADGAIIGSKLFEFREDSKSLENFCQLCKKATVGW